MPKKELKPKFRSTRKPKAVVKRRGGHTRHDGSTREPRWQKGFLASLSLMGNVTKACEAVNITRRVVYDRKESNKAFSKLWEESLEKASDRLEAEAFRRAHDGCERPIYQGGKLVGHVIEYSDTLMCLLLKAHKPIKYRENSNVKIEGELSFNAIADKSSNINRKDREIKSNPALSGEVQES